MLTKYITFYTRHALIYIFFLSNSAKLILTTTSQQRGRCTKSETELLKV